MRLRLLLGASFFLLTLSCDRRPLEVRPTRGVVLISIDTLRADHLKSYGYGSETSPFIDSLAERGVLFENAFVQLPGTLPSHMSIFTGLYPAEHGVYPGKRLSEHIPTLPEVFRRNGYRTAGFSEGGYVRGESGFARGFELFDDEVPGKRDDVELTFRRGRDFLRTLDDDEPFFLFLHTYAVHAPYDPPEPYRGRFVTETPADAFPAEGLNFERFNRGELAIGEEARRYYLELYDAGIAYVDDVIRGFWGELEQMGLSDDVTLVITSDHGEEFLDHGRMLHDQIFPETLHVPLIIVHPDVAGPRRVPEVVESVDIAPTLFDLAKLRHAFSASGSSLAGDLTRDGGREGGEAYAEAFVTGNRALVTYDGGDLYQTLHVEPIIPDGGLWIDRAVGLEVWDSELTFRWMSPVEPNRVSVFANGELLETVDLGPEWTTHRVVLENPSGRTTIQLVAERCLSPEELGLSREKACRSFKVADIPLRWSQLYDLSTDPQASLDLSSERPELHRRLYRRLLSLEKGMEMVAAPGEQELPDEVLERLRALGYVR